MRPLPDVGANEDSVRSCNESASKHEKAGRRRRDAHLTVQAAGLSRVTKVRRRVVKDILHIFVATVSEYLRIEQAIWEALT